MDAFVRALESAQSLLGERSSAVNDSLVIPEPQTPPIFINSTNVGEMKPTPRRAA